MQPDAGIVKLVFYGTLKFKIYFNSHLMYCISWAGHSGLGNVLGNVVTQQK